MRSSLIVLAIILATLRVVQEAFARRVRSAGLVTSNRPPSRFAAWRYYGFSSRAAQADTSDAECGEPDVVASSPEVGSVVSILPDDCVTTIVNGRVYRQCGSVWYRRQNTGSKITYVVVRAP